MCAGPKMHTRTQAFARTYACMPAPGANALSPWHHRDILWRCGAGHALGRACISSTGQTSWRERKRSPAGTVLAGALPDSWRLGGRGWRLPGRGRRLAGCGRCSVGEAVARATKRPERCEPRRLQGDHASWWGAILWRLAIFRISSGTSALSVASRLAEVPEKTQCKERCAEADHDGHAGREVMHGVHVVRRRLLRGRLMMPVVPMVSTPYGQGGPRVVPVHDLGLHQPRRMRWQHGARQPGWFCTLLVGLRSSELRGGAGLVREGEQRRRVEHLLHVEDPATEAQARCCRCRCGGGAGAGGRQDLRRLAPAGQKVRRGRTGGRACRVLGVRVAV
mmetsp:Transcript_82838/g.261653  ORF Transcript_82838/g.261653 Transcript_82838/m.261653 type:complete len:335 (-) Transcript_82838:117-1121(-)